MLRLCTEMNSKGYFVIRKEKSGARLSYCHWSNRPSGMLVPALLLDDPEQFMRPIEPVLSMDRNTQVFSFQNVQPKIIIL